MIFDFRARCGACEIERSLQRVSIDTKNPAQADLDEAQIEPCYAICPTCGAMEYVAMFCDGAQVEPWAPANEVEAENGPSAGPLPAKTWDRLRRN